MGETVLSINGMSCDHCRMAVEQAIRSVPGVTGARVDLAKKRAVYTGTADPAAVADAVRDAGYEVAG